MYFYAKKLYMSHMYFIFMREGNGEKREGVGEWKGEIDWLIGWSVGRLIGWLIDWLIYWLIIDYFLGQCDTLWPMMTCKYTIYNGMVSMKHGTILHCVDSARPIGHGPIVHENNRAPYRLDTSRFSTGSVMHETIIRERFSTGSIVHESVLQKRFGSGSIVHESVMEKRFGTDSIVHESVMQKGFSTSSIVHRYNCAPVMIHFVKTKKYIWNQLKLSWFRINI